MQANTFHIGSALGADNRRRLRDMGGHMPTWLITTILLIYGAGVLWFLGKDRRQNREPKIEKED